MVLRERERERWPLLLVSFGLNHESNTKEQVLLVFTVTKPLSYSSVRASAGLVLNPNFRFGRGTTVLRLVLYQLSMVNLERSNFVGVVIL